MDGWYYEANGERRGPLAVEQMKDLVKAGAIRRDTRVWRPGADAADLTRAGDFLAELSTPPTDNHLVHVLPVNRSGWAIAAGYLGLFSLVPFVCYAGVIVSSIAAWHLKRNPKKLGWGRVITGFVISVPMSILYTGLFFFSR
ncbi:MAG: hypothetical protein JWM53_2973 [bacterium]|nr:hypothetical protein [bacterium]